MQLWYFEKNRTKRNEETGQIAYLKNLLVHFFLYDRGIKESFIISKIYMQSLQWASEFHPIAE